MGGAGGGPDAVGPPVFDELDDVVIQKYRQDYRKFRAGEARGAMRIDSMLKRASSQGSMQNIVDKETTLFDFESSMDDEYKAVDKWRMDYRNFRSGNSFGAQGSLSALAQKLTGVQMRLLPVAQLRELRAFKAEERAAGGGLHVHFGAGKLGLGLVVPAVLQDGCALAIVQRPSAAWAPIVDAGDGRRVTLTVNGASAAEFEVITNDSPPPTPEQLQPGARLLVLASDPLPLISLLKKARTFSMSLGRGIGRLGALLEQVLEPAPQGQRPALYACENDHQAVHDLERLLRGRVDVHACMVDRICTTRDVRPHGVDVGCEAYEGSIVVQAPPAWAPMPPFKGDAPLIPKIKAETSYLCRRKFMMVNGMHTTLAFMTLCMREEGNTPGTHVLLNYAEETKEVRARVWAWATGRLLMLAWEHDLEIMADAHGVEGERALCGVLLDYARVTLRRFSGVSDTTTRVLSGGVANRWETRLKPVHDFLQGTQKLDRFGRLLLREAGVELPSLRHQVAELVAEGRRFTGQGAKKAAKQ